MLKKLLQRRYLIYYVLLIALLVRLLLLFNGQQFIDGDEAVVGVMARHITKGALPIARYGHHYGGGHVIEAYLAALLFVLTGITNSGILLKLPVVFFSLLTIGLTYIIVRRYASESLALFTAGLLVLAAPFLRSSFKVSGYMETIFFCLLSFFYFGRIIFEKRSTLKNYFLCGLWWGVAFWCYGFAVMYLAAFFLYFLYYEKWRLFKAKIWVFLAGSIAGSLVLIVDNLLNNEERLLVVFSGEKSSLFADNWFINLMKNLYRICTHELPAFLSQESLHDFLAKVPVLSWLYYLLFMAALVFAVYLLISKREFPARKLTLFSLIFIGLYLILYASTNFAGVSPRYFLALYPFIAILIAQLILALIDTAVVTKYIGVFLLVVYFSVQTVFAAQMAHNQVVKDIIEVQAVNVEHLIDVLDSLGIKHVHSGYFLKWRLIFLSDEKIIASCHNLGPKKKAYPQYERMVEMSKNYAVVLHTNFKHRRIYEEFLKNRKVKYRSVKVDDLTVFYDIKGNYRP